jgi:hypothetical protein
MEAGQGVSNNITRWFSSRLTTVLLLCSVTLNIILAQNVNDLRYSVTHLKTELRDVRGLRLGGTLPALEAKDLRENRVSLEYSAEGPTTVIYIFTPDCAWCTRNIDNVKMLAASLGSAHRFIGLSLSQDKLKEYVALHELEFLVCTELIGETASAYRIGGTPRTLVVSPEGRVIKSWFGAYDGAVLREIEEYFKIDLPGIRGVADARAAEPCASCEEKTASQPER